MTTATLSFCVKASGPDLGLIVRMDDAVLYHAYPPTQPFAIAHEFSDVEERDHVVSFEMRGKIPAHTQIDDVGNIIQDRCVYVTDIAFDNVQLGHLITKVAHYHHDTNGTTGNLTQPFYGTMGCNGRVEMRFSTPIYLWLLENM